MSKRHLPPTAVAGQVPVWNGTDWGAGLEDPNVPTAGESTFSREAAGGSVTLSSGLLRLGFKKARKTESITQMAAGTNSTAAGATPSLIRYGVYSVDPSTGDLTLVASTANDTSLLVAAFGEYAKALSSTWSKVAGTWYARGVLVVTGATAPTVYGISISSQQATRAPRLTASLAGQTDLPSTITAASLSPTGGAPQMVDVP